MTDIVEYINLHHIQSDDNVYSVFLSVFMAGG